MVEQTTSSPSGPMKLRTKLQKAISGRVGPIMLTLASACAGAILGTVIQDWTATPLRLTGVAVGSVSLLAIALSTAAASRNKTATTTEERLLRESQQLSVNAAKELADMTTKLSSRAGRIHESIDALSRQFGVQITFQSIEQINANRSVETDPSSILMLSVTNELLVLDWLSQEGVWPDESMDRTYMSEHQTAVIQRIQSLGQRVTYKRICQVDDVRASLQGMGTREMYQHLLDMQRLHDAESMHVVIKFAEKKFPYKFLIVDREGLILQLQEFDQAGQLRIWGELIIRDPTKHFIEPFLTIWHDMDDAPKTRTITMADLEAGKISLSVRYHLPGPVPVNMEIAPPKNNCSANSAGQNY